MQEITIEHRRRELRDLLAKIEAHPSRDWSEERKRILVLHTMIAGRELADA